MRKQGGWLVLSAVLALGGCQCLEPVEEGKDAGGPDAGGLDAGTSSSDAGPPDAGIAAADAGPMDAGHDAGVAPQCTSAAQCLGALPVQSLCNFGGDAGFSCIQQRCVFECTKGRACDFEPAGFACLACATPPVTACKSPSCGAAMIQGQVESSSCNIGITDVLLSPLGTDCTWAMTDVTGARGTMTRLTNGEYVLQFRNGSTCVGVSLFTQVERVLFSCENCQFVLRI
jgi:hypothetical protein